MVQLCGQCKTQKAALRRPKTFEQLCRECFYQVFEEEVHQTILRSRLFKRGEHVAIGASGGKDSTVLAHLLTLLNKRHDYGLRLFLLSIDEGITGYRDDSLETVKRNEQQYQIPLEVVSYKQLYGWTMDEIVKEIGTKNNCTFCGVFRRQALDRGATKMKADKVATGHNADDIAETVLLNILRGDLPRLSRCAAIITGEDGELPRVKPFKYTYQKEIVMYAYFKKLDYFSTECIYAPFAARGLARDFVKDLEATRPRAIVDLIHSAETFRIELGSEGNLPQPRKCDRCGYICSQSVCKACQLLEGLNKGLPSMGISRPGQVKSRTATKLAAEKLRALSVAADQAAAGQSSNCGKVSCQCAGGGSAAAARVSCSESEQCTASQKGDTAELGSFFGSAVDSCHGPASVGNDDGASGQSSPDDLQLPPQNVSAGQSSCGGACECDSASAHKKGGLSASSADWTLAGNFAGDGSDQLTCHPLSSAASMDRPAVSQQPLRVHGKLYESNLRQVNAHPSARRPVRADFATTW
ncbi:cytosolic thiouridylase subunit Ctu1 [Trebouxia sp. C0010 RCD-2024]